MGFDIAPIAQWTEYRTSNPLVGRSSRPGGAFYAGVYKPYTPIYWGDEPV